MLIVATELKPSPLGGVGVFAAEFIPAGSVVWERHPCVEPEITLAELEMLPSVAREFVISHSAFDGEHLLMCCGHAAYVNHSEQPNLIVEPNRDIAARDIQIGEELTENYHDYDQDGPDRKNGKYQWEKPQIKPVSASRCR